MEDETVQTTIEALMLQAAATVMAGNGFGVRCVELPLFFPPFFIPLALTSFLCDTLLRCWYGRSTVAMILFGACSLQYLRVQLQTNFT